MSRLTAPNATKLALILVFITLVTCTKHGKKDLAHTHDADETLARQESVRSMAQLETKPRGFTAKHEENNDWIPIEIAKNDEKVHVKKSNRNKGKKSAVKPVDVDEDGPKRYSLLPESESSTIRNEPKVLLNVVEDQVEFYLNDKNNKFVKDDAKRSNGSNATGPSKELAAIVADNRVESRNDGSKNRFELLFERINGVLDHLFNKRFVSLKVPKFARFFKVTGSSFMNGFILGFLAFGLKKLLLPFFIGMQIMKSIMIAMFLPSLMGSFGKLVGKGLSHLASGSSAGGGGGAQKFEDFNFNDMQGFDHMDLKGHDDDGLQDFMPAGDSSQSYPTNAMNKIQSALTLNGIQQAMNRYTVGTNKNQAGGLQTAESNYYPKPSRKKENFKIFHKIPSSSMLLTTYDPFYSPLLSRIDAIFKQMGHDHQTEHCRERLVCLMYANPTKYAPYSNLMSAQLSRELNELRKPTSDNADILRFFKYMKAARDGQDGPAECPLHKGCPELGLVRPAPAMLTTFNDINKLVHARKLI